MTGAAGMANRSESHERFRATAQKHGVEIVSMPMPLASELPDGARVDVTDPTLVPMGDDFAHRQLTYTHDGGANQPAIEIVFEVRGGVPVCASIRLWSEGETYIRAKDLKVVKLDNLRDDIYAYTGVFVRNPAGDEHEYMRKLGWTAFQQDRKRVERATTRRKITPELLSKVAEIHKAAPEGGRLEAVRAAFGVHERTALRYIAQARQKGLING
jgi:hypothetical protein